MKKKVLGPDLIGTSVDFLRLKRESLRLDAKENKAYSSCHEDGSLMLGIESSHFSAGQTGNVNVQDGRKQ